MDVQQRLAFLWRNQRLQAAIIGIILGGLLGGGIGLIKNATSPKAVAHATATPTAMTTAVLGATPETTPGSDLVATATKAPPHATATATISQPPTSAGAGDTAHLLRSINMSLFDTSDQLANDAATQALLAQHHTPIIRMPFRDNIPDAFNTKALTAIKNAGAIPMAIVHGKACFAGDALAVDNHFLGLVQQVFGQQALAYVEYGNEEDLSCNGGGGIDANTYTQSWNAVVPQLKASYPTFKFIGPVNYQANASYIATFAKGAQPQPDYVSWHEYVCNSSASDQTCLSHIANWATHVSQTNGAVQQAIGHTLPIMITEWNLDPNSDPRYGNQAFIQQWTTQALQAWSTLAASGVYAAMLYSAESHGSFQLINSDNTLTAQGQVFFL